MPVIWAITPVDLVSNFLTQEDHVQVKRILGVEGGFPPFPHTLLTARVVCALLLPLPPHAVLPRSKVLITVHRFNCFIHSK